MLSQHAFAGLPVCCLKKRTVTAMIGAAMDAQFELTTKNENRYGRLVLWHMYAGQKILKWSTFTVTNT
jgi:hypothetical protein